MHSGFFSIIHDRGVGLKMSSTPPKIAFNKNVGLKKLLRTLITGNDQGIRSFLKRHHIELDESIYEQLEERKHILVEKLKNTKDATVDDLNNSYTVVYTYFTSAIEKVWGRYGANISAKPLSYTARLIVPQKDLVKEDLLKEIQIVMIELDELIDKIIPDNGTIPEDFDETKLEEVLTNAFGHQ